MPFFSVTRARTPRLKIMSYNARQLLFLVPVGACLLTLPGCHPAEQLQPRWTQFHGDAANQGGLWVPTQVAVTPRWTAEIGPVQYSSPSIGAERVIYVGTLTGELVAVNADGTVRWRVSFPDSSIFSSPAIGANGFGDIYIISTRKIGDRPASTLHAVRPDGTLRWSFNFPRNGYTLSSPKEWGSHIFIYVRASSETPIGMNELLVFNVGGDLVARETVHGCRTTITGRSPVDGVLELLACAPACYDPRIRSPQPDPTVAIVDEPQLPMHPMVVVADDCAVRAFHWVWSPPRLNLLWHHETDAFQYCSPTGLRFAERGGVVIVARNSPRDSRDERGEILAYDIVTGAQLWQREFNEWVTGTSAAPGTILYVGFSSKLRAFAPESGEIFFELTQPSATVAPPSMSGAFLHVSLIDGMQSVAFALSNYSVDAKAPGGWSSPAIGDDGSVYMVTTTGRLRAYAPP